MGIKTVSQSLLAIGVATFAMACAAAQDAAAPAAAPAEEWRAKNLQVLPADLNRGQIFGIMKGFAMSLGVRCTHCHVGEEGQPLSTFDFASDEKPTKAKAREMLKMTRMLNEHHFGVSDPAEFKVTCYTCHRGSTKPLTVKPEDPAV